jgi:putative transposase
MPSTKFRYIDGWYNPRRIQQCLGGLSPDKYEAAWQPRQQLIGQQH